MAVIDRDDADLLLSDAIEDSVRKTPDRDAADIVEDDRVRLGIAENAGKRLFQTPLKFEAQSIAAGFVPVEGRFDLGTARESQRLRADQQGTAHDRFRSPAFTSAQELPSSGFAR